MRSSLQLLRFLKPYWKWAVLAPACMALEVAMDLMQPHLLQTIVDRGIPHSNLPQVLHTCAWMILFAIIGLFAGAGCGYFAVLAAQAFGADLRGALFRKVQTLSFANLDQLETGALITRMTSDVNQVQDLVMMLLRVMVRAPLLLVGSLVMAIITSPRLALLFLALIPTVLAALSLIINRTYPLFRKVQQRLDTLNTVLLENLAGVRVVKAFARADHEMERFGEANLNLVRQNITAVRLSALTMPVMMLTLNCGVVAAIWIGGESVSAGSMQVGQVMAFLNYLAQTLMSLMMVSMLVIQVSRAQASAQRVLEVMEAEPAVTAPTPGRRLTEAAGHVVFENVTFSYDPGNHEPVLRGVSFEARPGETVAIIGATGAGKSSLVHLVPRFYDVTSGRVTIDGEDVRDLEEQDLRRTVAVALQESVLFSGAIRDNICHARPDASEEEIQTAAALAQAEEFIEALPDRYDTELGQRGVNLSGGQKQRLAIARALAARPRVLILDDSTSAVDVRTEARIHQALAAAEQRQTRLIVAQRVSTVLNADRIVVLEQGRVAAVGTHEELLSSSPLYREIYESQTESKVLA